MSNEELTPIEEQALDALLDEMLGKSGPPDLSRQILMRLQESTEEGFVDRHPSGVTPIVPSRDSRARTSGENRSKTPVFAAVALLAALAALFAVAVALQPDHSLDESGIAKQGSTPDSNNVELADSSTSRPEGNRYDARLPGREDRKPPRGIPMMVETPRQEEKQSIPEQTTPNLVPQTPASLQAAKLVSEQLNTELRGYWNAIGIEPSADATSDEVVARLKTTLGIEVSPKVLADAELLQSELVRRQVARALASRWLKQITDNGIQRIDANDRDGLINELTSSFQSKRPFDKILASWIDGSSEQALAFYAALAAGPRHANGSQAMSRRLASLTMNVDLRCTRCHDSLIKGDETQQDYWSFAAFLQRGISRNADGEWKIDAPLKKEKQLFYDLPDGRRRVAEPGVASRWMDSDDVDSIAKIGDWSTRLLGSPELARGVVNSLWQLVHGQPLQGRIVDPISAPHNEALDQLEEKLTQDLLVSQFDLARTLSLIISSPATRRAVPEPLKPENVWVSNESDAKSAMNAVDAFAAALPPRVELSMNQRIDQSLRAIGAKIDVDGRPFVAQVGNASQKGSVRLVEKSLSADFPARASELPVQWLKLIKDERSRVDHLAYLAGMSELPANVQDTVEAMHEAEVDPSLLLHRVWWLVKP